MTPLRNALQDLDPGSRALLDLSLRQGMADDEIATLVGMEPGAIATARDRALGQLAERTPDAGPREVARTLSNLSAEEWRAPATAAEEIPASTDEDAAAPSEHEERHATPEPQERQDLAAREREGRRARESSRAPAARSASASGGGRGKGLILALMAMLALGLVAVAIGLTGGDDDKKSVSSTESTPTDTQAARTEPDPRTDTAPEPARTEPSEPDATQRTQAEEPPPAERESARRAALRPAPGGSAAEAAGSARVVDGNRLELSLRGLRRGSYEVWLYNTVIDARRVGRSSGSRVRVKAKLPRDASRYRFIDVSLEPADANPSHSGQSVVRTPLAKLLRGS